MLPACAFLFSLTLILAACGGDGVTPGGAQNAAGTPNIIVRETTAPTPTPAHEPTPEPVTTPSLRDTPPGRGMETEAADESPSPTPTPAPTPAPDAPFPNNPADPREGSYGGAYNADGTLSNAKQSWYFGKNKNHLPPTGNNAFDVRPFGGYHLGDVTQKVIYLTFDEGYENGYTAPILDVLAEKGVSAAFFVTKSYITRNPELIQRMVDEGHIVGNHSVSHASSPDLTDEEMVYELLETARCFTELMGHPMPGFFRPPMGEYSARTLQITQNCGYKTIFWSFAYVDWVVDEQPSRQAARDEILTHMHNGAVPLLHAVSRANAEALGEVIDALRAEGFTFLSLYDLPEE